MQYLPLTPGFFAILVGFFFIVLILRSVRYAYESLGVSSNTAIFLLLATLIRHAGVALGWRPHSFARAFFMRPLCSRAEPVIS